MSFDKKVSKARSVIEDRIEKLETIIQPGIQYQDLRAARENLRRWKEATTRLLEEVVNWAEAYSFSRKEMAGGIEGQPLRNLADEANMYRGFLMSLELEIMSHPEDFFEIPSRVLSPVSEISVPSPQESREIFIIHGHDELNLLRLKEILQKRWDLDALVLSGKPGKGRTLIEKFEQEAQSAVFALALLTPDDLVAKAEEQYEQPRPNVIFELGWFYGRLGRSRVCILLRQGAQIHSDLDGISRIEFDENVNEITSKLEDELIEAEVLSK